MNELPPTGLIGKTEMAAVTRSGQEYMVHLIQEDSFAAIAGEILSPRDLSEPTSPLQQSVGWLPNSVHQGLAEHGSTCWYRDLWDNGTKIPSGQKRGKKKQRPLAVRRASGPTNLLLTTYPSPIGRLHGRDRRAGLFHPGTSRPPSRSGKFRLTRLVR